MSKLNFHYLLASKIVRWLLFCLATVTVFSPITGKAYHHFYIDSGGTQHILKWRSLPVNFLVDNDSMTLQTEVGTAFTTWNNIATAQDVLGSRTVSSVNFDHTNFETSWGKFVDGQHEVIFDATGQALQDLGANPAKVNGAALTKDEVVGGQGTITDGFVIINGSRTNFDRLSTVVHELGHFQGLAHSSVGMFNSASPPSEALNPINIDSVPTMHPFSTNTGTVRRTPEADDIASLSELYPESTFGTTLSTIEGTVTRCASISNTPVFGVNVRAVNTSNTNIQIGRITGFDGNNQGRYIIKGLPPGNYRIIVEPIGANRFSAGTGDVSISLAKNPETNFATEYRSAEADENGCTEEIPDMPVNTSTTAGMTQSNQNIKVQNIQLAFVVDDTGSMSAEIGAVRFGLSSFISVMETVLGPLGKPFPDVAIVTFKDNVTLRTVSNNPDRLRTIINGLTATGGGDCPESSLSAMLAAGRILRNGGVAMLITDADSRADGPDRATVISQYRAKSLKFLTVLSGSCSGPVGLTEKSLEISPTENFFDCGQDCALYYPLSKNFGEDRRILPSISKNHQSNVSGLSKMGQQSLNALTNSRRGNQSGSSNFDEYELPPTLGNEGSVRTYSEISAETGGFFSVIPGIKTGNPTEITRYMNVVTNIAVSSVVPAVGLVSPGDGPRGRTLNVEIAGSNTNFTGASTVSFGEGIAVNSRTINSPEKITANITIAPDAALGFRDITVTTLLGGSTIETAAGRGAFNIINPPAGTSITSVTPSEGDQDSTLNVTIYGSNTNFASGTSVASFGAGITVNSTTVASPTQAIANITISSDATIGFRDVRVTTGTEVATENVPGPFFVKAPTSTIIVPRLTNVNPVQGLRGQTLDVTVTGENTHFVNGTSVLSFSETGITVNSTSVSSPTSATANITLATDATLGFRDVLVTTGSEVATALSAFQVTEDGTGSIQYRFSWFNHSDLLLRERVLNQVTAGSTLPIRFTLGGFKGDPYSSPPVSQRINCSTFEPIGAAEVINRALPDPGYSSTFDFYQTKWRTQEEWHFTCRELKLSLNDGTMKTLKFYFK